MIPKEKQIGHGSNEHCVGLRLNLYAANMNAV